MRVASVKFGHYFGVRVKSIDVLGPDFHFSSVSGVSYGTPKTKSIKDRIWLNTSRPDRSPKDDGYDLRHETAAVI